MDYFVCSIENFKINDDKSQLEVTLPHELKPVARPKNNSGQNLLWCAGGGSYVLGSRYLPLVQRSHDAPSNPGKLTIATGLSDHKDELSNPKLMIRELFEEVVIVKDNTIITPDIKWPTTNPTEIIRDSIASMSQLNQLPFLPTNAEAISVAHSDIVTVHSQEGSIQTPCHLCLNGSSVNILFYINLPELLDIRSLRFYDTETILKDDQRVHLVRPVFLYDLKEKCTLDLDMKVVDLEKTYHASAAIARLENIFGEQHD
jgi:hypothetical protein